MRPERYSYRYAANASRPVRARLLFAALMLVGLVFLIMARQQSPRLSEWRAAANDWVAPVLESVQRPFRGAHDWLTDKRDLLNAHEENAKLRNENEALRQWQSVAQTLKAENDQLRKLAGYAPVEAVRYVTAEVIAQSPDAYRGSLIINAGSAQGIASLQPVIDSYGLIGRTIEVGDTSARVLLLSDATSRVPVVTATSRVRAILAGTGDEMLRMTFIVGDAKSVTLGEDVMTTAEGGLIPETVMIGSIFRREANGDLLVKPVRPLAEAEFVRVMGKP
jgi:rod shape-determining protein MreC